MCFPEFGIRIFHSDGDYKLYCFYTTANDLGNQTREKCHSSSIIIAIYVYYHRAYELLSQSTELKKWVV